MTTVEVLTKALELLGPNGEHWYQGDFSDDDGNYCALGAIREVAPCSSSNYAAGKNYLRQAIGTTFVTRWNDAITRTFPDIREGFLKAISLAKSEAGK